MQFASPYQWLQLATLFFSSISFGLLGPFVIHRRMLFLAEALAHSLLPGLAIAYLLDISYLWGVSGAAILTIVTIQKLNQKTELPSDSAIGLTLAGTMGLGVAIMEGDEHKAHDLSHVLFGNINAISEINLVLAILLFITILLMLKFFYRELILTLFDPDHARQIGINTSRYDLVLMILIAFAAIVGMQIAGIILVTALLIAPAATASLKFELLPQIIKYSAIIAIIDAVLGYHVALWCGLPAGSAIILVSCVLYALFGLYKRVAGT